jgi:GT2 family glycosyltransferase
MNQRGLNRLRLVPEEGIEIVDGETVASTCPAWLRIEPITELARHRWIKLRYSSSFFDEPVRPLIRFITRKGETINLPMNGPVLGSAEWIGRVPDGTVSASINPVRQTGRFAFRIDGMTSIPRAALAGMGLRRSPDWLFWAARSRLVNSRREAWQALSFAASGTPIAAYAKWHARLARPIDLGGLDRPRSNWRSGPVFRLMLRLRNGDLVRLHETIQSLRAQIYPRWSVSAITNSATSAALLSAFRKQAVGDPRLSETACDPERSELLATISDGGDYVALIDSGDCLPEYGLAAVAETLTRDPELELVYSDEECITPEANQKLPILKPDWSPILEAQLGYVGRLAFFRSRRMPHNRLHQLLTDEKCAIEDFSREIPRSAIRHVRRILYRRQGGRESGEFRTAIRENRRVADPPQWPEVAVVIPTRDGSSLLAKCLSGLKDKTDYPHFETVIVDNGSTALDALRLLKEIATKPRTTVLRRPGPFNFSAMSNDGARITKARVLLFLNNDIAMLDGNWLKAMVRWAIRPDVGVVGAKLLFPGGLIQHAGVVLGLGGIAGHVYRRSPGDHRGYLAQLTVPHEVAAVTGACIAIERTKFEAVGGFDAENLPVDLNDIDFCLRINELGWSNIWTPEATLIHHQSATRGIDSDPFELYRKERGYFVQRWSHVIRDDPYFHPGLSLYAHAVGLS